MTQEIVRELIQKEGLQPWENVFVPQDIYCILRNLAFQARKHQNTVTLELLVKELSNLGAYGENPKPSEVSDRFIEKYPPDTLRHYELNERNSILSTLYIPLSLSFWLKNLSSFTGVGENPILIHLIKARLTDFGHLIN